MKTTAENINPVRPVVLMPTFNNAATLESVMSGVRALRLPLMVVNDGCTDDTATVLAQWSEHVIGEAAEKQAHRAEVLTHSMNRGKAAALQTGFAAASVRGFTHAVTLDSDGQHDPSDIPNLLKVAERHPRALVLGVRSRSIEHYPQANLVGRNLSNAAIRLQTGVSLDDSQCGLRIYPLSLVRALQVRSGGFGFEAEVITRAAWAGCSILEAAISCSYAPKEARVSHYSPWRDSTRAVVMHLALLTRSLIPWPHRKWEG